MSRLSHLAKATCGVLVLVTAALWYGQSNPAQADPEAKQGVHPELSEVLGELSKTPTGRSLMQRAVTAWTLGSTDEIASHLKWGNASRTDAVLIRHYDPDTGKESRERKVTIYLRRDQTISDLTLDLAHELVHATSKPSWDPYDPKLTAGAYIRATIEGEGGEVDAVRAECQVSREAFGDRGGSSSALRCKRYWNARATDLIRRDFYRVGRWMGDLKGELGEERKEFPLLSDEKPALYSSTGGTPYPVALFEEYRQMTAIACENTRRRSPASGSTPGNDTAETASNVRLFLAERCR